MWHKPCRTFHPWCLCIKTRCLFYWLRLSGYLTRSTLHMIDTLRHWSYCSLALSHSYGIRSLSSLYGQMSPGRGKMAAILQTAFSNQFSWIKPLEFQIKIHKNMLLRDYRKVSNIRRTLVGNKVVDHSDVVGASPVGAAPNTSSFST